MQNSRSWDIDFLMAFLSTEEVSTIRDIVIVTLLKEIGMFDPLTNVEDTL